MLNFKSVITLNYFVNQSEIIELFCENKEEPQLQCNGKCHLAKELIKTEQESSQLPFAQNTTEYNLELIFDLSATDNFEYHQSSTNQNWMTYSFRIQEYEIGTPTPPPKV